MTRLPAQPQPQDTKLVRILSELGLVDSVEPDHGFAQKMSLWVNVNHAIALRSVLGADVPEALRLTKLPYTSELNHAAAPGEAFTRLRADLVDTLGIAETRRVARAQVEEYEKVVGPFDVAMAFEPYRRIYTAQQRDLAVKVRAQHLQARVALTRMSPALKKLADLDAAFDAVIHERADKLFAALPLLLGQRFGQLFDLHQQKQPPTCAVAPTLAVTPGSVLHADKSASWLKPGGWLDQFADELQTFLLAELDSRLRPVRGLMAAADNENHQNTLLRI